MPVNPFLGTLIQTKMKPSDFQLTQFRRYAQTVEDPVSVLKI